MPQIMDALFISRIIMQFMKSHVKGAAEFVAQDNRSTSNNYTFGP